MALVHLTPVLCHQHRQAAEARGALTTPSQHAPSGPTAKPQAALDLAWEDLAVIQGSQFQKQQDLHDTG